MATKQRCIYLHFTSVALLFGLPGLTAAAQTSPEWLGEVRHQVATAEYGVTWQEQTHLASGAAAWHAPNRAHGFRSYFTEGGSRLMPRASSDTTWTWGLTWIGYGRGGEAWSVPAAQLAPRENRIDYLRGELREWYVNDPRGLKQSFLLPAPPVRRAEASDRLALYRRPVPPSRGTEAAAEQMIHVDLELQGTLSPSLAADGQAIDFLSPSGARVLRYDALIVTDARGRDLPAWMETFHADGRRIVRLAFDASSAAWPVTIDPLATSPAWSAESDQAGALFGFSVATAGDVNGDGYSDVIVGAYLYDNGEQDEGRAFVYHGSASGLSATPAWTAESDQINARFGISVAPAGDVNGDGYSDVIVGAENFANGQNLEGRAFVYYGSAAGLSVAPSWTAESNRSFARFGGSVATAGDVNGDGYADVVVGARFADFTALADGRAYVYHGSPAGLQATPAWTADGVQAGALFGTSVATAGDVDGDGYADVIVGAPGYSNGESGEGRAFLYRGSAAGLSASASWTTESDQVSASLGTSVATAGDVDGDGYADVLVGIPRYDDTLSDEGRVYLFRGSPVSPGGLDAAPSWNVNGQQIGAQLGGSVATAGDVNGDGYADVIVGASRYDNTINGVNDAGAAFVYLGSISSLSTAATWTVVGDQPSAELGIAVATAGDVDGDGYSEVIVGEQRHDNGEIDEGRAWVYHGSPVGLENSPFFANESNSFGAAMGFSVGTAGDVNGDGYADVIVGLRYYDNGNWEEGAAWVFHGSPRGLSHLPAWRAESNQDDAGFGASVGTAGDVNGDGYSDVIVGAYIYDNGQMDEGAAFVWYGGPGGLGPDGTPANADWMAESDQGGAQPFQGYMGWGVGTAGDVNGDGYSDVIVGAYRYSNGHTNEGSVFVWHGGPSGLAGPATPASADWRAESDQDFAHFGRAAGTAGDVNGDGYSDVIVGASQYSGVHPNAGAVFVWHGGPSGLGPDGTPGNAAWRAESDQPGSQFGWSDAAATAGDVNGDGYADVIVGAYLYQVTQFNEGAVFVWHGGPAGLGPPGMPFNASWTAAGLVAFANLGFSVSTAGDVNGDGYADVIAGAFHYTLPSEIDHRGAAYAYHGSAVGLAPLPSWIAVGPQFFAEFGHAVAGAGDVNGDGYADVVVGAPFFSNPEPNEGRIAVFHGNGLGVSLIPRQGGLGQPVVDYLGASDSADSLSLSLLGRTPFGRGRVRVEQELKPLGALLDGSATQLSPTWADTGTTGVDLIEFHGGLAAATPHHWRQRLHYDSAGSPWMPRSRWLTRPWRGWQETMLRTGNAGADLFLVVSASPDPVFPGDTLTYTTLLINGGPGDAANVTFSGSTPIDTSFAALVHPAGWNCVTPSVGAAGSFTCDAPLVLNGQGLPFVLTVTVDCSAAGTTLVATLDVTSTTPDPLPGNVVSVSSSVYVEPAAEIDTSIRLTHDHVAHLTDIDWTDTPGPYNVYRGDRAPAAAWAYNHGCHVASTGTPAATDAQDPSAGELYYYLVTRLGVCGESVLGYDSAGNTRPNSSPCP